MCSQSAVGNTYYVGSLFASLTASQYDVGCFHTPSRCIITSAYIWLIRNCVAVRVTNSTFLGLSFIYFHAAHWEKPELSIGIWHASPFHHVLELV
jgi:hypothetical protein